MVRKIFIVSLLVNLTACGGGGSESLPPLTAPSSEEPITIDTTIDGVFEGEAFDNVPDDIEPESIGEIIYRDESTNELSQADINRAPNFSYEEFIRAYELASKEWPDLDKTSDDFANQIIDNLIILSVPELKIRSIKGIYDQFNKLTAAEKILVIKNPIKAYKSKKAADTAIEVTSSLFSGDFHLTRADAFRHSYWNWLMSKCCSVSWAWSFATAHESEAPNNDDRRMDLNNNIIGRNLYRSSPSFSESDVQLSLLNYNLLWINSELENVQVGIDYLVYLEPDQSITVWDDGPVYDDIYTININGTDLGDTPKGGSKDFIFRKIPSGEHLLDITCKLDGTKGGCGFRIILKGAMTLSTGRSESPFIVVQESETYSDDLTFPIINDAREK